MIDLHAFESRAGLGEALAERTARALGEALAGGLEATWWVSGGSTPKLLFSAIARQPEIDWARVHVALVDERWVPMEHARSNEAFIARELEPAFSAGAKRVGMYAPTERPADAVPMIEARYRALPPVAACLLGLGSDGHTASLFPGAEGLDAAMDPDSTSTVAALVATESEVTGAEVHRLSLTAAAIAKASFPHLLISGEDKRAALERALEGEPAVAPISRLIRQLPRPLEVFWAP